MLNGLKELQQNIGLHINRIGLTALQANTGLQDCAGVIGALLAADRKLEQEAIEPRYAIGLLNELFNRRSP